MTAQDATAGWLASAFSTWRRVGEWCVGLTGLGDCAARSGCCSGVVVDRRALMVAAQGSGERTVPWANEVG
jgi:hypothetical protein